MIIEDLLKDVIESGGSDLHVSAGLPPIKRVDGKLIRMEYQPLTSDQVEQLLFPMMSNDQRRRLEQDWELDFSYGIKGMGRFRVNFYKDKGSYAAAFRSINSEAPTLENMGMPPIVTEIAQKPRGLVLVTGPTGSGKSTTLAAMIDYINRTRAEHILTIEDPIEFVHKSKMSVIHQRELGMDTRSFANALKSALREDPDIILVGEMRDHETIALALTAAETGHLVFGTLHTSSASQTIDRIIDVFPEGQQQQIRVQLANSLVAVFAQTLLPKQLPDGTSKGRVMAQEIMIVTPAVSNLIREAKAAQIYSTIQTSSEFGMQTLEASLAKLVNDGLTKSIGVSNYNVQNLLVILSICKIKPAVIQVECHPYWSQEELRKKVGKFGTIIESWYPIGHGDKSLIDNEIFTKLGKKYNKTNVQIILRWHIQKGNVVFPKSTNPKHIKENSEIFDFNLTNDEMEEINKLGKTKRFFNMPLEKQEEFFKSWTPKD